MTNQKQLREDYTDYASLQAAMKDWASKNNLTISEVENMVNESPIARQLVMNRYWESKTL